MRFIVVGSAAAVLQFSLTYAFIALGARPAMASAGAYGIAFCSAYVAQKYWTFESSTGHHRTLPRYLAVQLLSAALAAAAAEAAAVLLGLPTLGISIMSTLVGSGTSYVLSSRWAFAAGNTAAPDR
jgi:putative flippase GtrA